MVEEVKKYFCINCGTIITPSKEGKLIICPACKSRKIEVIAGKKELGNECLQYIATRQEDIATERIVEEIEKRTSIYTTRDDVKSELWIYDNGIYKPNGESYIKEFVRTVLSHAYTPQRANKVIAKIEADTMIDTDEFFGTMYLDEICVNNGILNLNTREITDFTPKKIFFNKIPVDFIENAKCENIDKFFGDVLKEEEDKSILYELAGFCLHKEYFIEKSFMFLGSGRNGKGKTLSLLKSFLGVENTCSVRLQQMDSNSTGLTELHNRLVNLAGDLNNTALKDTGIFKELTGRDIVQVKRKYLRDLIFTNYAKMIFACNELPRVYDLSEGFWSRWILLEFPYQFLPQKEIELKNNKDKEFCKIQDPSILDKLTTNEELSGLLNMAIDGLDRLKRNKDFSYSKGTASVKDFWIRKSDSFTAFCLDSLDDDVDGFVLKKDLRKMFNGYCKTHKIKGSSEKNMKIVLEDMFGVVESRKTIGNDFERVWEGISIKNDNKLPTIQGIHVFSTTLGNGNSSTSPDKVDTLDSSFLDALKILSKESELIKKNDLETLPFKDINKQLEKLKTGGILTEVKEGYYQLL